MSSAATKSGMYAKCRVTGSHPSNIFFVRVRDFCQNGRQVPYAWLTLYCLPASHVQQLLFPNEMQIPHAICNEVH